jgi:hypothetical protein
VAPSERRAPRDRLILELALEALDFLGEGGVVASQRLNLAHSM